MNTRIVSISRQVGTSGEEVAQAVASLLGFQYIDYQVIQEAAVAAGVSTEAVSEAEHTPSLMTRILEGVARNPSMYRGRLVGTSSGRHEPGIHFDGLPCTP